MVRSSVDFPAPFAPMIAYTSPGYTASEMPESALSWPWWTTRSRTSSNGAASRSPGPFLSLMLLISLFQRFERLVRPQVGVAAEVDLAHPGVREHLRRGAVADELPAVQAGHPGDERGERADHVLDPDHRGALGVDAADDLHQHGDLGVGQTAGPLVKQQQGRPGGDRAGDLQPLARQQPEPAGRRVGLGGDPGPLKRARGDRVAGLAALPAALLGGEEDVLEHG